MPTVLQVRRNEGRQREGASRPRRFKSTKSENAGCGKKRSGTIAAEGKFFLPPTHPDVSKIFAVRAPQGASHRWVNPGLNGYPIRRASGR